MMDRWAVAAARLLLPLAIAAAPGRAAPDDPAVAETPGLIDTQLTVIIEKDRSRRQFRATLVGRSGDSLTLLTAAHCVVGVEAGTPVFVVTRGEMLDGALTAVRRNPAYHPAPGHDLPGPDNAVIRVAAHASNPAAERALRAARAADRIVDQPTPGAGGRGVGARVVDGRGREHAIRGGNFQNPLWLEWAGGYQPRPGDSGSGVFALARGPAGEPVPILIGVVVGHGLEGGGASLVSRRQRWLAEAIDEAPGP